MSIWLAAATSHYQLLLRCVTSTAENRRASLSCRYLEKKAATNRKNSHAERSHKATTKRRRARAQSIRTRNSPVAPNVAQFVFAIFGLCSTSSGKEGYQ